MSYFTLSDGLKIAYQEWGNENTVKVFAVHGWLDNSNSFSFLGPFLCERGFHVIAIDMIGHGFSDHLGTGAVYSIPKSLSIIREILDKIQWQSHIFLGHSMGASIGVMYASIFPEKIAKLVLIDGIGPLVREADSAVHFLKKAVEAEVKANASIGRPAKVYPRINDAIDQRILAVKEYPGKQFISRESVISIIARAVKAVDNPTDQELKEDFAGPVQFRHDRRLLLPTYIYPSREQGMAFFHALKTKILLIRGESGFPPETITDYKERLSVLHEKGLLQDVVLPGSHHLHLDPDSCGNVAEVILNFLSKE